MRQRAALCEHPFSTMKRWLGWDHFLVRGFKKVRGEMALLVNCYNLRRLFTLFGVVRFMALCEERRCQMEGQHHGFLMRLRVRRKRLYALCRRLRPSGWFFPVFNPVAVVTLSGFAPA